MARTSARQYKWERGIELIDSLHEAGATEVILSQTYGDTTVPVDEIEVSCSPEVEGDILIKVFTFGPDEVRRTFKSRELNKFSAWWD